MAGSSTLMVTSCCDPLFGSSPALTVLIQARRGVWTEQAPLSSHCYFPRIDLTRCRTHGDSRECVLLKGVNPVGGSASARHRLVPLGGVGPLLS